MRLPVRIAILGALLTAIVSVLLLRAWSLQVVSGEHYRALADDNQLRSISVQPPRGRIVDRDGRVLVDNRAVITLVLRPSELPKDRSDRRRELAELADLLGLSPAQMRAKLGKASQFAGEPIVLQQGVRRPLLFYLLENRSRFPGLSVERAWVRRYRAGSLAAHVLGFVGQVSPAQLKLPRYDGVRPGAVIGQSGVEHAYDRHLRGTPGELRLQVDALGRPKGELGNRPARAGDTLRLSLDAALQATGEAALRDSGGRAPSWR